jgi:hypothetical protein
MPISGGQAARSEGAREVKEDVEGETFLAKFLRSSHSSIDTAQPRRGAIICAI